MAASRLFVHKADLIAQLPSRTGDLVTVPEELLSWIETNSQDDSIEPNQYLI
jgi:hypothetical protein